MNRGAGAAALIASLALVAASCSASETDEALCSRLAGDTVESLLGDAELETFSVEPMQECVWTSSSSTAESITLRLESVPDGQLFVEHAIEATPPERVEALDLGDRSVLFADEAVLGRHADQIVLITATIDTGHLVPVLEHALRQLGGS